MTLDELKNMEHLPDDILTSAEWASKGQVALNPLTLLRRLELAENLNKRLSEKGLVSETDREIANLQSTLNHAQRIIDIRQRKGTPVDDLLEAVAVVNEELRRLEGADDDESDG